MLPADKASIILSRIQKVCWDDIDPKLPEMKPVAPRFEKHDGTTTTSKPGGKPTGSSDHNGYAGNFNTSIGTGFGPPTTT